MAQAFIDYLSQCVIQEPESGEGESLRIYGHEKFLFEDCEFFPEQQRALHKLYEKQCTNAHSSMYYEYMYIRGQIGGKGFCKHLFSIPITLEPKGSSIYVRKKSLFPRVNLACLLNIVTEPLSIANDINEFIEKHGFNKDTITLTKNLIMENTEIPIVWDGEVNSPDKPELRVSHVHNITYTNRPFVKEDVLNELLGVYTSTNDNALAPIFQRLHSISFQNKTGDEDTAEHILKTAIYSEKKRPLEVTNLVTDMWGDGFFHHLNTGALQTVITPIGTDAINFISKTAACYAAAGKSVLIVQSRNTNIVPDINRRFAKAMTAFRVDKNLISLKGFIDSLLNGYIKHGYEAHELDYQRYSLLRENREARKEVDKAREEVETEMLKQNWFKQIPYKLTLLRLNFQYNRLLKEVEGYPSTNNDTLKSCALQARRLKQLNDRLSQQYIREHLSRILQSTGKLNLDSFRILLRVLPVCVVDIEDLHLVPMANKLFDKVIVLDAQRMSVAQLIPALYRGETGTVCADPHMYPFITKISSSQDEKIREEKGVNNVGYPKYSAQNAYTFASTYCSTKPYVFSSLNIQPASTVVDTMYGGRLEPTTIRKAKNYYAGGTSVSYKDYNISEAVQVVDMLDLAIKKCKRTNSRMSMGVATPFHTQARLIQTLIAHRLTPSDVNNFNIKVYTLKDWYNLHRELLITSWVINEHSTEEMVREAASIPNVAIASVTATRVAYNVHSLNYREYKSALILRKLLTMSEDISSLEEEL